VEGKPFFFGKGCDKCNNTGYKGRMGLHELIIVDDDIRDAISGSLSTDDLRAVCEKKGMISLRESGMRAIHKGKTTIDEVVRETVLESN
jgi:type IV pilus assembly protein PilB